MTSAHSKRALFLDFDGTLVNNLHLMREVYGDFLARFSKTGTTEEFQELNGPSLPEIAEILKKRYALADTVESLLSLYNQLIDEKYERALPMPGALEVIQTARNRGITVAIVTSNTRQRVTRWLQRQGVKELPSIVAADSGLRGKPWPDLYQAALTLTQCETSHSWAVEDSANGQLAAHRAGLHVLAFQPNHVVDSSEPTHSISDLREALRFFPET